MTRWLLALIYFLLATPCAFAAEADLRVEKIISDDELLLNDNRTLRLSGIKAVDAVDYLNAKALHQNILWQNPVTDRYGRIQATVFLQGHKESLQDDLLSEGLAFVYPATGDVEAWIQEEATARHANKNYWATHPDTPADSAEKLYGSYGFVTGIVTEAARIKNKVYLNFGTDWHSDFTITIAAHDLRAFKHQEMKPLEWQGRKVRVRGWVKRDFGPMITVTDPHQIELLK